MPIKKILGLAFLLLALPLAGLAQSQLPLNGTWSTVFQTYDLSTNQFANPDSTPSCSAYAPNTNTATFTANAVNRTTGKWRWAVDATGANGFTVGVVYRVECDATFSGVAQSVTVGGFRVMQAETATGAVVTDVNTIRKNVANQTVGFWMYSKTTNLPLAGLTNANITCRLSKDNATSAVTNDTSEDPVDAANMPGRYFILFTQAETNANNIALYCNDGSNSAWPVTIDIQTQR